MRNLLILLSLLLIYSLSFSLFLTQSFEFDYDILDISRIYNEKVIVVFEDNISEVKLDGTIKEIIKIMEGERAYISPYGNNFLIVGRPDETNTSIIALYSIDDDIPLYSTISSDSDFFVIDGGNILIGYSVKENNIHINFYDSDGIITVDRDYDDFEEILVNESGSVFIKCGEKGIFTVDNEGNEYGNIMSFPDFTIPRNKDLIAGYDGDQLFFYSNNQENYRLYVKLTDIQGMRFSPSGDFIIIWDNEIIYLIDAVEYVEEWNEGIYDPSLVITDIDVDQQIQNIVYATLRDWGDAFPPEDRYTEPGVILLDENGHQRYIEPVNLKGCSPDSFNLDIDDNGINIYLQTQRNLFLYEN